jgi:hypothetical protein
LRVAGYLAGSAVAASTGAAAWCGTVDEAALEDLHASLLIERVFAGVESRGERRFVADR